MLLSEARDSALSSLEALQIANDTLSTSHATLQTRLRELEVAQMQSKSDDIALLEVKKARRDAEKRLQVSNSENEKLQNDRKDFMDQVEDMKAVIQSQEKKIAALEVEVLYGRGEAEKEEEKSKSRQLQKENKIATLMQESEVEENENIDAKIKASEQEMREKAARVFARTKAYVEAVPVPEAIEGKDKTPLGKRKRTKKSAESPNEVNDGVADVDGILPPPLSALRANASKTINSVGHDQQKSASIGSLEVRDILDKQKAKATKYGNDSLNSKRKMQQESNLQSNDPDESDDSAFLSKENDHAGSKKGEEVSAASKKAKFVRGPANAARKSTARPLTIIRESEKSKQRKRRSNHSVMESATIMDTSSDEEEEEPAPQKKRKANPANKGLALTRQKDDTNSKILAEEKQGRTDLSTTYGSVAGSKKKILLNTGAKNAFSWGGGATVAVRYFSIALLLLLLIGCFV